MAIRYQHKIKKSKPNGSQLKFTIRILLIITMIGGGIYFYGKIIKPFFNQNNATKAEDVVTQLIDPEKAAREKAAEEARILAGQNIEKLIAENPGIEVSVAIRELDSSKSYYYGSSEPFIAASTTKLITAAAYFNAVENGRLTLTKMLGNYNAAWQIKQMINQSNNISWELLNNDVGYKNLASYAKSIGITSFDTTDNSVSAADELLLLEKLHKGTLLNETNTSTLLSHMTNTNFEKLVPAALPDYKVYHKYGQLNDALHDAAIVMAEKPFAIVIFTHTPKPSEQTAQTLLIHEITKSALTLTQ